MTRSLPARVALAAAVVAGTGSAQVAAPGHRLAAAVSGTDTYLIDDRGIVVHVWPSAFEPGVAVRLTREGRLLRTIATKRVPWAPPGAGGGVQELLLDGTVVWDFRLDTGGLLSHHDVEPLPNGNVLLVTWEERTPTEAIAAGRDPARVGERFLPDRVVEVCPTGASGGEVVWEWRVWDHLIQDRDPAKANFGDVAAHPGRIDVNWPPDGAGGDWNHVNAIRYDPVHDRILLTACFQDELWIVDHATTTEEAAGPAGDLLFRWGNPAAHGAGTEAERRLASPHDGSFVAPGRPGAGNVLVFNNKISPRSEVLEVRLPELASEDDVQVVWRYSAPGFDSDLMAGAERLPNGNTLVCSSLQIRVFEVTPAGEVVWETGIETFEGFPFDASYVERTLWSDRRTVSALRGGEVRLDLIAGSRHAGRFAWVATELAGLPLLLSPGRLDERGRRAFALLLPPVPTPTLLGLAPVSRVLGGETRLVDRVSFTLGLDEPAPMRAPPPDSLVVDFTDPATIAAWRSIDDVVMGGVSSSALVPTDAGTALFQGELSLEQGGGFASVRSPESSRDLSAATGLRLRFRGDGRRYKLRLRTERGLDGVTYQAPFESEPDAWAEVELAFDAFEPVYRGRPLPDAPALDRSSIASIGLLVSDGQAGRFRLELAWLATVAGG